MPALRVGRHRPDLAGELRLERRQVLALGLYHSEARGLLGELGGQELGVVRLGGVKGRVDGRGQGVEHRLGRELARVLAYGVEILGAADLQLRLPLRHVVLGEGHAAERDVHVGAGDLAHAELGVGLLELALQGREIVAVGGQDLRVAPHGGIGGNHLLHDGDLGVAQVLALAEDVGLGRVQRRLSAAAGVEGLRDRHVARGGAVLLVRGDPRLLTLLGVVVVAAPSFLVRTSHADGEGWAKPRARLHVGLVGGAQRGALGLDLRVVRVGERYGLAQRLGPGGQGGGCEGERRGGQPQGGCAACRHGGVGPFLCRRTPPRAAPLRLGVAGSPTRHGRAGGVRLDAGLDLWSSRHDLAGDRRVTTSYYGNFNPELLRWMPLTARDVLELGCGEGALAAAYKRRNPAARYTAIEAHAPSAAVARGRVDRLVEADIQAMDAAAFADLGLFDAIVMGDVLEHLADPWAVLKRLHDLLREDGALVLSVPNAGHWSVMAELDERPLAGGGLRPVRPHPPALVHPRLAPPHPGRQRLRHRAGAPPPVPAERGGRRRRHPRAGRGRRAPGRRARRLRDPGPHPAVGHRRPPGRYARTRSGCTSTSRPSRPTSSTPACACPPRR